MRSTFYGLDIALRALLAQQTAIDVTNHNVANASTPGYTRQSALLAATDPFPVPGLFRGPDPGQLGTGVEVQAIRRLRDAYLDQQVRGEIATRDQASIKQDTFDRIEVVFREPSDSGLNSLLGKYWQAWHEVANSPSDPAVRSNLVEQGVALATAFNRDYSELTTIKSDLDSQIRLKVNDVNGIAQQIAVLNQQIKAVTITGDQANDLRDRRDNLVDQLAGIMKVSYLERADGTMDVFVGSHTLVHANLAEGMSAVDDGAGQAKLVWNSDRSAVVAPGGELAGLFTMRDDVLVRELSSLDSLARRIMWDVNGIHAASYGLNNSTGVPFFTGTGARDLAVDSRVTSDPNVVAAAGGPDLPGDGSRALAIGQLQLTGTHLDAAGGLQPGYSLPTAAPVQVAAIDVSAAATGRTFTLSDAGGGQLTMSAPGYPSQTLTVADMTASGTQVLDFSTFGVKLTLTSSGGAAATGANIAADLAGSVSTATDATTIGGTYGSFIASLGVEARSARLQNENQTQLVDHLNQRKESISGVSLDEETTNLVRYQRAYQAAARVMTSVDEMLDVLINRMGLVGR